MERGQDEKGVELLGVVVVDDEEEEFKRDRSSSGGQQVMVFCSGFSGSPYSKASTPSRFWFDCYEDDAASVSCKDPAPPVRSPVGCCGACLRNLQAAVGDRASFWAMIIMAFSALIYSFQYLDVKKAGRLHGSWTIAFFRGLVGAIAALVSALMTRSRKGPIYGTRRENIKWLVLRGLLGGATIITAFLSIKEIQLSDASVLIATSTIFSAILGVIFENGSWSKGDSLATLFCIAGVVLVTKPGPLFVGPDQHGPGNTVIGVLCALTSAVCQAGVNLTIRKIKEEDPSVITLYAMVGCTLLSFPGMMYEQVTGVGEPLEGIPPLDMVQLYSTGLLSYGAQILKTMALQLSKTIGVLVFRYLDSVFSYIWDVVFFHTVLDAASVCGGALIISGCLMDMFAKSLSPLIPSLQCPHITTPVSSSPSEADSDEDYQQAPPA